MTQDTLHTQKPSRIQNVFHLLKRRKMLIYGITFLGFSLSAFLVQSVQPLYTAHAQIIFENQSPADIKTQQVFISSPQVAQSVVIDLRLMNDPSLNPKAKTLSKHSKFKTIDLYDTKYKHYTSNIIARELEPIVAEFRSNFSAEYIENSHVLDLTYTANSPQKAARILNRVAQNYINHLTPVITQPDLSKEEAVLKTLQTDVETALSVLEKYKKDHMDTASQNDNPAIATQKNQESYEKAQANYERAKANLAPFLSANGNLILNHNAAAIKGSKTIKNLLTEKKSLESELDLLSKQYGPKHPKIKEYAEKFDTVHDKIAREKKAIMYRAKSRHDKALAELQTIKDKKPAGKTNSTQPSPTQSAQIRDRLIKFETLKAQAQTAIKAYTEYEARYNHALETQKTINRPAQILTRATIPQHASFPNKTRALGLGTLLSFLFGLFLTLFIEKTRNTFLSGKQLEEFLDLPCYALIPKIKKDKDKNIADYVLDHPTSSASEAVRALRLVLKLRADADKDENTGKVESKVITLTSSFADEGKSTLSSWLARLAAKSGERVILIDADLRRPTLHKNFGKRNMLSLVEYLGGQSKLEEVIDTNDPSGLHVIYGRAVPSSAIDLLSSDKMDQLIRSLRKAYDLIIIDSPACMAVSDARALEKLSDQLLYIVQWNKTNHEVVHNGISQFIQFRNARIATVLTNIDLKKHVQFGYGEAINSNDDYKEYCAA